MGDVIFVAVILAFFALALGLVRVCERIIGPEELEVAESGVPEPVGSVA